ncbi:MAG: Gfo/Idh/MocA family oxidoreductase [Tannerella sp.]|jgi:predicted dehydrogenase|nr:Gfo/Idh/MocA family oxidoreductase [Tannerella sp.]
MTRRDFVKNSVAASVALGAVSPLMASSQMTTAARTNGNIRVGVIGLGRGGGLMGELLKISDVEIVAVCDLFKDRADRAVATCKERRNQTPKIYCKDEKTYLEMLDKERLDAVIIAPYWEYHAPMALEAMKRNIYPAIEVPCALTVDECWALVETSEKTGIPCMMLENWSFRRDNLAILNMIRQGLFGEIVHSHCAHSHDCIDHWFFDSQTGADKWPAKYLVNYNRDQYPTHSVGPVLSWLDINCGDRITEIYSTASASKGINAYFKRKFGEDHPNTTRVYKQGDIVTSLLKTAKGKTFVINYDLQLPRPYSNRWLIQGTLGVYDEEKGGIYLNGKSPKYHEWEDWKPYEEQYLHRWWQPDGTEASGHGGVDYIELREFINAVRAKGPTPIDVYDSVVMSAIVELSGISIEKNQPVQFPDFTKGKWETRAPYFGI